MDQTQRIRAIREQMWKEIDAIVTKTEQKLFELQHENTQLFQRENEK